MDWEQRRSELVNDAVCKLEKLNDGPFHGYRSEVWSAVAIAVDAGRASKVAETTGMKWLCSVCGMIPVDRCPKCGLNEDKVLTMDTVCPTCYGAGTVPEGLSLTSFVSCDDCKGTGKRSSIE